MATIGFDTHRAVKALTEVGFSEPQAETVVTTVRDALGGDLATKFDLAQAKAELEAKFESEIKSLELRMTLRFGGMIIAAVGIMIAAMSFLQ